MKEKYPTAMRALGIPAGEMPPQVMPAAEAFVKLMEALPGLFYIHPTCRPAAARVIGQLQEAISYEGLILHAYEELEASDALDLKQH